MLCRMSSGGPIHGCAASSGTCARFSHSIESKHLSYLTIVVSWYFTVVRIRMRRFAVIQVKQPAIAPCPRHGLRITGSFNSTSAVNNQDHEKTLGSALPPGTGACIINLDSRTDRWESLCDRILPQLEPLPLQRIPATLGTSLPGYGHRPYFRGRKRDRTWAARAGCVLSHRAALLHAKANNWPYVLILEDDITFSDKPDSAFLDSLGSTLPSIYFDICFLGHTDPVPPFRHLAELDTERSLHQVFGCNTAHAYLVSSTAISRLLELLPQPNDIWKWLTCHRAVDRFYYRNLSPSMTVIALSPAFIEQEAGFSDILVRRAPAYAECHCTKVPIRHPSTTSFQAELYAQARFFHRTGQADALRGFWKRLNGF